MEIIWRQTEALWFQFMQVLRAQFPHLIGALAVLIIGWLVALVAAMVVRGATRRTEVDKTLIRWLAGKEVAARVEPGEWLARGVYYLLMLFVLIAFFHSLGLPTTVEPINRMLVHIFEFIPRVLVAGLLLLVAWILARVLQAVVSRFLMMIKVDERLGSSAGRTQMPVARAVGTTVYWIVLLVFLPAILDALRLSGLLLPVQEMLNKVIGFLPNLLASILMLTVGWFGARIVQRVLTNVLSSVGLDRIVERAGLERVLGKETFSGLIGLIVYILILIPIAIAALDALQIAAISGPASLMLATLFSAVPAIFTAAFLLVIAFVAGRIVARLVSDLMTRIGFDALLGKLGLDAKTGRGGRSPSEVVGYLVMVGVVLFAVIEAADLIGFASLAGLLVAFMEFAGQVLLGLVIFGVGLYLANLAASVIRERKAPQSGVFAMAAKVSILTLATAMALQQMGLASKIITLAFGLLFGATAIAFGIAFGLGARRVAAREVEKWIQSIRDSKGTQK